MLTGAILGASTRLRKALEKSAAGGAADDSFTIVVQVSLLSTVDGSSVPGALVAMETMDGVGVVDGASDVSGCCSFEIRDAEQVLSDLVGEHWREVPLIVAAATVDGSLAGSLDVMLDGSRTTVEMVVLLSPVGDDDGGWSDSS